MNTKICCVTGHRDIPPDKIAHVQHRLHLEVHKAIRDGYTVFISGFAQGADLLFAQSVVQWKKLYPHLLLEAAIPHEGRMHCKEPDFHWLLRQCHGIHILSLHYRPDCFTARNRYIVQRSQRVLAVYDGRSKGGTVFTIRYAHEMGKDIRFIPQ